MLLAVLRRIALVLLLSVVGQATAEEALVVFAAASLTDSLQKVTDEYTATSGVKVKLSFAASSALAKQMENGAGADVFISADQEWMDYLVDEELIRADSRQDLLGNRLVLIAPVDSKVAIKLGPGAAILGALGAQGRLATGEPTSVPAGKYAQAALTSLGLWTDLEPRLARAENVRVALSYVARGEAPLGIVYATDAAVEPKVRVVDVFPESTHPAITYPAAMTSKAGAAAASYLQFLQGPAAAAVFSKAGFAVLSSSRSGMISGCAGFAFDLAREIEALDRKRTAVIAGSSGRAATLQSGTGYAVTLLSQSTVKFAVTPERAATAAKPYAGVLQLAPDAKRTTVRVTLNAPAWIDLVEVGRPVVSTRHTGSRDCPQVRKSVEFAVKPGAKLLLQISNSAAAELVAIVSRY